MYLMTDPFAARRYGTDGPLLIFLAIVMPLLQAVAIGGVLACSMPVQAQTSRVTSLQQVAPGIYAALGQISMATPQNRGVVANQGIIVGEDGVILIGTGTSARHMTDIIATVRRLTPKPIMLAINTHQNPAFVFGNGTLALQGVPILAHEDVAALIGQRCEKCLQKLNHILGPEEMEGTRVVVPTRIVDGATSIDIAGRHLDILYYGHSSSPGSIAVVDRKSGVLFAGGLASIGRIPDAKDARIHAWLMALEDIKKRRPSRIVPGEGPISSVAELDNLVDYLNALQEVVEQAFRAGIGLGSVAESSQLPQYEQWPLYDNVHNKNVEHQYLEVERRILDGELKGKRGILPHVQ